jgi:hypothetical protein
MPRLFVLTLPPQGTWGYQSAQCAVRLGEADNTWACSALPQPSLRTQAGDDVMALARSW